MKPIVAIIASLLSPRAGAAARAQGSRTGRVVPTRLHVFRIVLRATRRRPGRYPAAAERKLSAWVD